MDEIVVGIDVGTTKVCTLVGRVEDEKSIRILGVGIEPSEGIKKGMIVDLARPPRPSRVRSNRPKQTSGLEITRALVSLAGAHVSSVNSRGRRGIPGGVMDDAGRVHARSTRRAPSPSRTTARSCTSSSAASAWTGRKASAQPIGMHGYQPGSGDAHHHRLGRHGGQPAPVRGRGRRGGAGSSC